MSRLRAGLRIRADFTRIQIRLLKKADPTFEKKSGSDPWKNPDPDPTQFLPNLFFCCLINNTRKVQFYRYVDVETGSDQIVITGSGSNLIKRTGSATLAESRIGLMIGILHIWREWKIWIQNIIPLIYHKSYMYNIYIYIYIYI